MHTITIILMYVLLGQLLFLGFKIIRYLFNLLICIHSFFAEGIFIPLNTSKPPRHTPIMREDNHEDGGKNNVSDHGKVVVPIKNAKQFVHA